ncbi:MAG: LysR family transcriptional regulator [Halocynthiibacter sp.]
MNIKKSTLNWEDLRIAGAVARAGKVSAAAAELGIHHATVIRHVDALEAALGHKLFLRHARGYQVTDAGMKVLQVVGGVEDQICQLSTQIQESQDIEGAVRVTSLAAMADSLVPILARFQRDYPSVTVEYGASERLYRLEYGEAHVAIRAGTKPDEPDNVVQALTTIEGGLYAAPSYIERHGLPTAQTLDQHLFVGFDQSLTRIPINRWLWENVPHDNIIFTTNDWRPLEVAICEGMGIGFPPKSLLAKRPDLVEILPPRPEWRAHLWAVTHVDFHRSPKVQAILRYIKEGFEG